MSSSNTGPDLVVEQTTNQILTTLVNLMQAILAQQKVTNFLLQEGLNVKDDLNSLSDSFLTTNSY